jgi:pyruvate formate lyase activating enzyme
LTFKGWQKTSLIEYPGKIATVVFTGGCNFRCPFCYNADLVEKPKSIPGLAADTVLEHLRGNRRLYQALVVSGGEPTLHAAIPAFLARVKSLDLCVGLETNGSNPALIAELLAERLVDFLAMDLKAPLETEAYGRAAALEGDAERILEDVKSTLELLRGARIDVELRLTVVPTIHAPEDVVRLAARLDGFPRFVLQQFQPQRALDPRLRGLSPFAAEELEAVLAEIRPLFDSCELRGL